jgi:hypothetical protein
MVGLTFKFQFLNHAQHFSRFCKGTWHDLLSSPNPITMSNKLN